MSDTFANEFEKWLERKTCERTKDNNEESTEESENDSECAMNTADNYESESEKEKCSKHLLGRRGKVISGSISEQAPILVDDDDDVGDNLFTNKKQQQYEDEPPVLEPAPMQLPDYKVSDSGIPRFCPQHCMRNYSRNNHTHSRSSVQEHNKSMKTYSNKDKAKHLSETCNESSHKNSLKPKDKKGSGNIFDKFNSDSYEDFPPPLIPSPEALRLNSASPKSVYKYPSNSPDFCAMEADSTSEITEEKEGSLFSSQRLSKNSVHGEVAIECDSTCMLAASPVIVSPVSVCNGETEEGRDTGGGNKDGDTQNSDSSFQKCDDSVCVKEDNGQQLLVVTDPRNLVSDVISDNAFRSDLCERDSLLHKTKEPRSHQCPHLSDVRTCDTVCNSFPSSVTVETESNSICGYSEPPVLSVISPPLKSHRRSRKKRHTIDSPENFYRSRKRLSTIPAPDTENFDCDILTPPTLTHVSETAIALCPRGKRAKVVSQHSKDCQSYHQDKNLHRRKRQQRFNTLPFADLTENSTYLSEDLHNFIINTSQLSELQTHMHMLLYQLFPQLRTELDTMSPESAQFEILLSDLVISLKQPDIQMEMQENSSPPPLILCKDTKPTSYERPVLDASKLCNTSLSSTSKSSSPLPALHDCQAAGIVKHILNSDALCSSTSSRDSSHNYTQKRKCTVIEQQNNSQDQDCDLVIPHLAQLTVKDVEDLIIPSKVLLFRDPGVLLERFVQLSCRALQLLLPDLTVSLCNELAGSPHDLVVFIDNVILTNSRR